MKTLDGCHFKGHCGTRLTFSITTDYKSSKVSLYIISKDMSKKTISHPNKRALFSNFALYSKGRYFSITRFDILIFCNILNLEMISYHKVFYKNLVKIKINTKSKKKKKKNSNGL